MKKQFVQIIQRYPKTIGRLLGIIGVVMAYSFLFLVTSMTFHWRYLFWSTRTGKVTLVALMILCAPYGLLYTLRLRLKIKACQKHGYDYSIIKTLVVSTETIAWFVLCAVWGLLVLTDHPSTLPLKLMVAVWITGFVGLVVLRIYELRRQQRGAK